MPAGGQAPKQPGVDGEITTGQVAARRDGYDPGNIVTCVQTTARALGHHSFPVPSPSRPRTHENQNRTGTTQHTCVPVRTGTRYASTAWLLPIAKGYTRPVGR